MDEAGHTATIRVFLLDDHEIVRRGGYGPPGRGSVS
jgi:hypothetical protein